MVEHSRRLAELLKELGPELQQEVRDFAEFLLEKRRRKGGQVLRQNWAGALRAYRDQYTSMDLQKKVLEWRGD